jgi:hypothetical protein
MARKYLSIDFTLLTILHNIKMKIYVPVMISTFLPPFFKRISISVLSCILILTGYSCSSNQEKETVKTEDGNTTLQTTLIVQDPVEKKITDLKIEKLFWNNRLKMAQDESFDLSLDLVDSVIFLEIKGVPLRKCKIDEYHIADNLMNLKFQPEILQWLGQPFILQSEWADIPKEPIKIRHISPQDTSQEDVLEMLEEDIQEANLVLRFNRNLTLHIGQQIEVINSTSYRYKDLAKNTLQGKYEIMLALNMIDTKAIYRALSTESELTLRY